MNSKKILILCPYPQGVAAGQRLKYEQYFESWKDNNFEITVSSFSDKNLWEILYLPGYSVRKLLGVLRGYFRRFIILFTIKDYDLVYVFMWVTPIGGTFFERLIRRFSKKLIFDFDDFVHKELPPLNQSKWSRLMHMIRGGFRKSNYLIKNSDYIIISSPFHQEYCKNLNVMGCCDYIPCSLDTNYFKPLESNTKSEEKITIGWTGTFSSKPYLDSIKDVFIKLSKNYDFQLVIIGNFEYEIPGLDLKVIQWSKEKEIQDLQLIDIGIYPLFTNEWELGKGALKAMQYMSVGIPVVATKHGTTPYVVEDRKEGILVNSEQEWIEALSFLIDNPEVRLRYGASGRNRVLENYSVKAVQHKYLSILKFLI